MNLKNCTQRVFQDRQEAERKEMEIDSLDENERPIVQQKINVDASIETIRRQLRANNLKARSPRKVSLLTKTHVGKN